MKDFARITTLQSRLALALIAVLAIIFLPTTGTSDVCDWLDWAKNVYDNGIIKGYAINHHEHPPYFSTLLYLASALAHWLDIAPFYGLKLSFLLALLCSVAIIYFWSSRNTEKTIVFFIPLAYSCLALSYMDIYFTPFFLLAVFCINQNKPALATAFFIAASLIKAPPLIIAPFLLVYSIDFFKNKNANTNAIQVQKQYALYILLPAITLLLLTYAIFGNEFLEAMSRTLGHNCLSCGALNFNRISPIVQYDIATHQNLLANFLHKTILVTSYNESNDKLYSLAIVLFAGFYLSSLIRFTCVKKTTTNLLLFCILGHFSYFMFSKGAHENHLYMTMLIAICLATIDKQFYTLAINICLISSLNLFLNYGINGMPLTLWWDKSFYPNNAPSLSWLNAGYPFDNTLLVSLFDVIYFLLLWYSIMFSRYTKSELTSKTTNYPLN